MGWARASPAAASENVGFQMLDVPSAFQLGFESSSNLEITLEYSHD